MTHTPNMYGSNLKEYAQNVLDNKQIAVSTRAEWNMLIKRLPLENFTYPPVEIDLYNMVTNKYSNPRTRTRISERKFSFNSSLPLVYSKQWL